MRVRVSDLVVVEEVGHLARVEDVVDVLEEGLLDDLVRVRARVRARARARVRARARARARARVRVRAAARVRVRVITCVSVKRKVSGLPSSPAMSSAFLTSSRHSALP